jgi:iron transport multicopper oxidase
MALSLSNFLYICNVFNLISVVYAEIRTYNLNVGWVTRNPDGHFDRPVIGINGQWPIPRLEATVGDRVVVNLNNQLGNESTSLHFHGLFMNGTNEMDGVVGVTQCGIPPGSSFTYNFTVWQPSVQWYLLFADRTSRFTSPGPIGTILTSMANIPMASEVPLSFTTQIHLMLASTMKSWS